MCKKRENSTNPAIKGLPSSFAFLCLFVSYKRAFGVENDTLVKDMTIKNGKAFWPCRFMVIVFLPVK